MAPGTAIPWQTEQGSKAQRERRRRILDATLELASQGGFDAVQMRTVAERADVALGTLYRYFPSKIHLLVSTLAREFDRTQGLLDEREIPGATPPERVIWLLKRITRGLQADLHLAEALTRAFMFADSSVKDEIHQVGVLLTQMLTRAIRPQATEVTDDDIAMARVIGDVRLASMVDWVTGRESPEETATHMERAVTLLLR